MRAEPGRRSLKMHAEKLGPVIVGSESIAPRVNLLLARTRLCCAGGWTGRQYRFSRLRFYPTGEIEPSPPDLVARMLNQLYHFAAS